MIELTEEQLKRWREIFAKDGIIYDTDDDYKEAVSNLVGYFEILIEMDLSQKRKAKTE